MLTYHSCDIWNSNFSICQFIVVKLEMIFVMEKNNGLGVGSYSFMLNVHLAPRRYCLKGTQCLVHTITTLQIGNV